MRQIISKNSVKAFYLNRECLLTRLTEIAKESAQKFLEIKKVILFGSLAKKEETGLSDIDLFIVVENGERNPLERLKTYFNFFVDRLNIALDMIVALESEEDNYCEILKNSIILFSRSSN